MKTDKNLVSALAEAGVLASRSEARRQIAVGRVRINEQPVSDIGASVQAGDRVSIGEKLTFVVG